MEETNIQASKKEEIDLWEILIILYRKIKWLIVNLFIFVKKLFFYLIRRMLWLAAFAIAGAFIGAGFYHTVPKTYRSELILRTNSLASSIVIEGIENLNNAFKSKNYEEVSKLLNVNKSEMSKIYHLEVYYGMAPGEVSNLGMPRFYTRSDKVDTIPDGMVSKYIKIVAEVFDEDVYPKLTLGLLYFINSGSFGNGLNVARVEQIKAQIAHAEQGITALQQLLINYTYSKGNTISNLPLQMEMGSLKSEPVQLYDAIDALYSRKSELEQELTLFSQLVAVIADFNKTYRIVQQPHIYILWGAVAAFVLGFFGLLLWDNRKKFANDNSGKT